MDGRNEEGDGRGGGGRPGWWGETRYLNLKGALPQWESLPTDRHTDEPRQAQSKQKRKDAREISQMMPRSAVKPRPPHRPTRTRHFVGCLNPIPALLLFSSFH